MNDQLKGLKDRLEKLSADIEKEFGHLNSAQLNWKPGREQWSVGQCLHHLYTTNGTYFPQFDLILQGEKKKTVWESLPVLPTIWGSMLKKSIDPRSTKKVKTSGVFEPSSSTVPETMVKDLMDQNKKLVGYLEGAGSLNCDKVIITSPAASFITYSLSDAFNILVIHEQRHFLQAERVKKMQEFPK